MAIPICTVVYVSVNGQSPECGSTGSEPPPPVDPCPGSDTPLLAIGGFVTADDLYFFYDLTTVEPWANVPSTTLLDTVYPSTSPRGVQDNGCIMVVGGDALSTSEPTSAIYDSSGDRPFPVLDTDFHEGGTLNNVFFIEQNNDGTLFFIAIGGAPYLQILDADSRQLLPDPAGIDSWCLQDGMKVDRTNTKLAYLSNEYVFHGLDITQSPPVNFIVNDQPAEGSVQELQTHPDYDLAMLLELSNGALSVYDISTSTWAKTPGQPAILNRDPGSVQLRGCSINPIDKILVTCSSSFSLLQAKIYAWDVSDPDPANWVEVTNVVDVQPTVIGSGTTVPRVKFSPDGKRLVTVTGEVWDSSNGLPYTKITSLNLPLNTSGGLQNRPISWSRVNPNAPEQPLPGAQDPYWSPQYWTYDDPALAPDWDEPNFEWINEPQEISFVVEENQDPGPWSQGKDFSHVIITLENTSETAGTAEIQVGGSETTWNMIPEELAENIPLNPGINVLDLPLFTDVLSEYVLTLFIGVYGGVDYRLRDIKFREAE